MSSGPEHYRKAELLAEVGNEKLIDSLRRDTSDTDEDRARDAEYASRFFAAAQAHATLALAAAQALSPITVSMGDTDRITEWARATACSPEPTEGK